MNNKHLGHHATNLEFSGHSENGIANMHSLTDITCVRTSK